jgi:hypothetical protein
MMSMSISAFCASSLFATYHLKNNSIYTGADRAPYVLLPIVPAKSDTQVRSLGGIKVAGGGGGGQN